MGNSKLNRRNFMRMMGCTAATLPILKLARARAQGPSPQKNLLIFYTPHGGLKDRYVTGTGSSFTLQKQWAALDTYKQDCTFLEGCSMQSAGTHDMHFAPILMLTAEPPVRGSTKDSNKPGGPSIDYHIATSRGQNQFEYCGIRPNNTANATSRISASGRGDMMTPTQDPRALLRGQSNIFANTQPDDGSNDEGRINYSYYQKRMRGGTTFAKSQYELLRQRESQEVRETMDNISDHLSDLFKKYQVGNSGGVATAECRIPTIEQSFDYQNNNDIPKIGDAFVDIIVNAFACGERSVATLQWSRESEKNLVCNWVDYEYEGETKKVANTFHDDISHSIDDAGPVGDEARAQMEAIVAWQATKFAEMVKILKDRALLDNTVAVWMTTGENSDSHRCADCPVVISGGGNAFSSHGTHRRINENNIRLMRTIAQKVGANEGNWSPGRSPGVISGL